MKYIGAGGKGGASTTYAIDRDACQAFIRASIATPSVKKFLLVTALNIRRNKAPWWSDETWEQVTKVNTEVMPDYYKAKRAADDVLTVLGEERRKKDSSFKWIALRPGLLKVCCAIAEHLADHDFASDWLTSGRMVIRSARLSLGGLLVKVTCSEPMLRMLLLDCLRQRLMVGTTLRMAILRRQRPWRPLFKEESLPLPLKARMSRR